MPRNTREWAQRKIDMVIGNMETAKNHLDELISVYAPIHEELGLQFFMLQETITELQKGCQNLKGDF